MAAHSLIHTTESFEPTGKSVEPGMSGRMPWSTAPETCSDASIRELEVDEQLKPTCAPSAEYLRAMDAKWMTRRSSTSRVGTYRDQVVAIKTESAAHDCATDIAFSRELRRTTLSSPCIKKVGTGFLQHFNKNLGTDSQNHLRRH